MFGPELVEGFREFKRIWDPDGLMNPGKIVDPYRANGQNLRHLPPRCAAHLPPSRYSRTRDAGDFSRALQRCVGVGECRRAKGGVMCPSFMVTREEKHDARPRTSPGRDDPRGCPDARARRSTSASRARVASRTAPSASMSRPGRRSSSHAITGPRPASAYSMGLVHRGPASRRRRPGSRTSSHRPRSFRRREGARGNRARTPPAAVRAGDVPRLVQPAPSALARASAGGGGAPSPLPTRSRTTSRPRPSTSSKAPDSRSTSRADACCGRPLFDWGMLDTARRLLAKMLDVLSPAVDLGVPIVVLEPSCAAFPRRVRGLFPRDARAARLSEHVPARRAARVGGSGLGRPSRPTAARSCSSTATSARSSGSTPAAARAGNRSRRARLGLLRDGRSLRFREVAFAVSVAIGERILLPEVRKAAPKP